MPKSQNGWNQKVTKTVDKLIPVKEWLATLIEDDTLDWGSQKAAHQALKFLELAEYEMWHLQYWENETQKRLHEKAHIDVAK